VLIVRLQYVEELNSLIKVKNTREMLSLVHTQSMSGKMIYFHGKIQ